MKKLFTTFKTLLLGGLMLSSLVAGAQQVPGRTGSYPLTSDRQYTFGIAPSAANQADAVNAYNAWKQTYVATDCGNARVIFDFFPGGLGATDRSETVSEGIAYGMLLSAYAGDRTLFDGLWAFYKSHRNGNGVMNWKIRNCNQVTGQNGASDAELDVAMALIVASFQWQNDTYENDARSLIRIIREKEFDGAILKPGDQFGGRNLTNPSYFSPAYYEVYKDYDPGQDAFWNAAIAKGYEIIDKADKNDLGLVPDWVDENGNTTSAASQYTDQGRNFFFDAVRTPFRSAVDYLWHGRAAGKAYCEKLINWSNRVHNGGTEQLQSKYTINGQSLGGGHSNTFVGCFSIAAMATNNQSYLNRGYADNQNTNPGTGQYFNATFKVLANFVMSGNFYLPPPDACTGPSLGADKSLCSGSPAVLNAGVTANSYEWRRDGNKINGATSRTYNATVAGDYEVVTNQDGCVRRDRVNVGGATLKADFVGVSGPGSIITDNTSTGGVSSYSWEVNGTEVSTEESPILDIPTAGLYEVTLTITNDGFAGCSGSETVTKSIAVGDGEGVALDDFNGLFDKGINLYTYGPVGGEFEPFPVTYCSKADADAGGEQLCQNNRCSYVDLVCNGTTANWATMEFEFLASSGAPFDLANGAYVSMKMSASEPVTVAIRLGTPGGTSTFLSTPQLAALTTEEQVFTFDFTDVLTGDIDGTADVITGWDAVTKLAMRPYVADLAYEGTISVDYVIVGSKALEAPNFDIRKDAFGYTEFGNYLPDYFPNDPQYADCTPSTEGPACYGAVPDWEREIIACGPTATVVAKACLATEIRWYSGNTLVETGDEAVLAPGDYTIELIGPGGVTTDVVKVIGSNPVAAFSVDRTNYDATFINQSTGFNTLEWNYGDVANDLPGSTLWDIGYHSYQTAGDGTYTVSITVTDTVCDVSDTETKQLVIACDQLTGEIIVVDSTVIGCEGDVVTFEIEPVENAQSYGWFGPEGTTLDVAADSLSATVTFGAVDGPLTIEAYNSCSAAPTSVKSVRSLDLDLAGKPVGTFVLPTNTNGGYTLEAGANAAPSDEETYAWTFGDGNSGTGATVEHTYATSLKNIPQTVCLTVTNRCAVSDEECDEFTPTEPVGFFTLNEQNVSMFPTATTNSLTVELSGKANITISDVLGNTVSQKEVTDKGIINVSDLSAGMYILSIKQGSEVVNKRFIKE